MRLRVLFSHSIFPTLTLLAGLLLCDQTTYGSEDPNPRLVVQRARELQATKDVSLDLKDVLEPQNLSGACGRHFSRLQRNGKLAASDQLKDTVLKDMLRCGKWLFFYADFASKMAIPENILKAIPEIFPKEAGPSFTRTGLIENPYDRGFPIGFVRLKTSPWGLLSPATGAARGISCATCHFGKMPDGRFAAGMPNQDLDFGKVNALLVYSAWRADYKNQDQTIWPEELQSYYKTLDTQLKRSLSPSRTLFDVAKLVSWVHASDAFYNFTGASRPLFEEASTWLSGTPNQYYASSPLLPVPGRAYWMSAPAAWDMKNYPGDYEAHSARPLSSFSPSKSAEDFVALAYIFQTGYAEYSQAKYVDPLVLYFRSLKTPKNLQSPNPVLVERGQKLFTANCRSCHNGADGETLDVWPADQLGTPSVLVDPLLNYVPPKKLSEDIYNLTVQTIGYKPLINDGVYGRKLKGIYARRQLMINGSVKDLDHAFCLTGMRGHSDHLPEGLRDDVHMDLCMDYEENEKIAIKAFLENWDE